MYAAAQKAFNIADNRHEEPAPKRPRSSDDKIRFCKDPLGMSYAERKEQVENMTLERFQGIAMKLWWNIENGHAPRTFAKAVLEHFPAHMKSYKKHEREQQAKEELKKQQEKEARRALELEMAAKFV